MFNLRVYVLVLFHDSKLGAFTLGALHCALAKCLLGLALLDRYEDLSYEHGDDNEKVK